MSETAVIAIPARLSSQRLPRKMLLAETGRPLIEHTWRAARGARRATHVAVVTDSAEIAAAVQACGGHAVMTSPDCTSGTARIVSASSIFRGSRWLERRAGIAITAVSGMGGTGGGA